MNQSVDPFIDWKAIRTKARRNEADFWKIRNSYTEHQCPICNKVYHCSKIWITEHKKTCGMIALDSFFIHRIPNKGEI